MMILSQIWKKTIRKFYLICMVDQNLFGGTKKFNLTGRAKLNRRLKCRDYRLQYVVE